MVELPLELLPVVFDFVHKSQDIFKLCLVNTAFNRFATPLLYRRIVVLARDKGAKFKVSLLFRTLSQHPHLAYHVEQLEIRDFPKALSTELQYELLRLCARGIRNCVNLRSCAWTRDGSVHSCILESLGGCPRLHELDINGSDSSCDPMLLVQFSRLSKIRLIMPSPHVLDIFPTWISITGETLCSLTIVCMTSVHVTDAYLARLAPNLRALEHLYITGCPKVTHQGIGEIASVSNTGLVGMSVEIFSRAFDMSAFKAKCLRTDAFRRLSAIYLTAHIRIPPDRWMNDIEELLSSAPLEVVSISSVWFPVPDEFWGNMVIKHGRRLKTLFLHGVELSLAALEMICLQCPLLEKLSMATDELEDATRLLALAKSLRVLHVSYPLVLFGPHMERANTIVSICSPTLTCIGCNTEVWQVERIVREDENGEKYVVPTLVLQESPDIPEQLLVVRT